MGRKRCINKPAPGPCQMMTGEELLKEFNTPNDSDPKVDKKLLMSLGMPESVIDAFLSVDKNEDEDGA